jgi:hypothetical protein
MNIYFFMAAIVSLLACVGHFTLGYRQFLRPMQQAQFDPIANVLISCAFHYLSVFLLLSTMVLFACGFMLVSSMQSYSLVLFIALNFILFAIWQLYIGYFVETVGILSSWFQWGLFVLIGGFILLGTF